MLKIKYCAIVLIINLFISSSVVFAQETLNWTNDIPSGGWPNSSLGPHSNSSLCHSRGVFTSTVLNPSGITFSGSRPSSNSINNNSIIHGISGVPDNDGISQTFSFGYPVENLSFSIFDIDGAAGNWQDRLIITASLTGTSIPVTITTCPPAAGTICTGSGTISAQVDAGTTPTGFTSAAGRGDFLINGSLDAITIQYLNHTVPVSTTQFISITELTYNCAIVGVSKVMTRRAGQAVGVSPYIVDIDFNFENFGDVTLSNLTSLEDLDAVFNAPPNVGNYNVTSITQTSGPATFTANAGFDGSANQELIGLGSSLLPSETASIRVTLSVNNYDSYVNTITVNGTTPQMAITSDDSTNGTDSDGADGDENPDESTPSTLDVTLLPVSLNYFSAQQSDNKMTLEWQTDIEFSHLGFEIYQEDSNSKRVKLPEFIVNENSKLENALKTYNYSFNTDSSQNIWLADINNKGTKTWHGPFKVNDSTGNKITQSKVNWSAINETRNNQSSNSVNSTNTLKVAVTQTGMQRITYNELIQAGMDLNGITPHNISISLSDKNIPLYINGNTNTFDATTSFDFYANNIDTLYTNARIYKLSINTYKSDQIKANIQSQSTAIESWYWQTEHYNPNLIYDFSSPTNDPWRADKLATFATSTKNIEFPMDELSPITNNNISLRVEVSGGIDYQNPPDTYPTDPNRCGATHVDVYPGLPNDHCLELSINSVEYAEIVFDGLSNEIQTFDLNHNSGSSGTLEVGLSTPGETGFTHDLVHIEDISITYPRRLTAINNRLDFQIADSSKIHNDLINQRGFEAHTIVDTPEHITQNFPAIKVDGFNESSIIAYSLDAGNYQRIKNIQTNSTNLGFSAKIPAIALSDHYWLSTESALLKPNLSAWSQSNSIDTVAVDYIIISHPDFINAAQQLADLHRANGLIVEIVDVNDVYQQFSESIVDPKAIKEFIQRININRKLSYVLLIGADNYDYKGYLDSNHFSHIPSFYSAIDDIVRYAPADSLYTDIDNDNIPDIAIGRLPVRTVQELQLLIDKEINFVNQSITSVTSQFITDKQDDKYSYSQISNDLHSLVPEWSIMTANRDDFADEAATKQKILDNFSQNPRLTTYLGHSGPRNWFSFPSAFTFNDIIDVNNSSSASVVMQWGCWNSYYVEPEANTMAHRFLFNNDKGAVAVFGASALTSVRSEQALAKLILPELAKPRLSIGQAMINAKKQLATQGDYRDIILGWNLLGDPAIKLSSQQE